METSSSSLIIIEMMEESRRERERVQLATAAYYVGNGPSSSLVIRPIMFSSHPIDNVMCIFSSQTQFHSRTASTNVNASKLC